MRMFSSSQAQAWEDRQADREREERECAETPEQRKENDRRIRESLDQAWRDKYLIP